MALALRRQCPLAFEILQQRRELWVLRVVPRGEHEIDENARRQSQRGMNGSQDCLYSGKERFRRAFLAPIEFVAVPNGQRGADAMDEQGTVVSA